MSHIQYLLLGAGNGAVFAALALALVVTYRSSGVINFAASSVALYSAYTYAFLRQGELLLIIPGLPDTVDVGGGMGFWPAAALTLLISAVVGLVMYALVFRPLRTSPPVARAVASLGLMTLITALISERLGTDPVTVDPIFPDKVYTLGSARVPGDRLWFAAAILLIGVLLALAYRFTRFGLATRAAAETERGAVVSGISPDRVAAWNWVVSAMVAGLSGILIAPIVPLVPASYSLFIVPALAAAILGRFQYLGIAVAAGLAIGMLQSEMQLLHSTYSWLPSSGLPELVPLVLILLVLVVRARPLPSRGETIAQTLGRAPRPRIPVTTALVWTAVASIGLVALDGSWRAALLTSLIMGMISLSLVVVTGYAGQVSLAQLTLAGAAGFLLSSMQQHWDVPFPIAPLLAALGATVIGVVVGLPALRVRGLTVAVVTLGLASALEALWFRNNDLNGGFSGAQVEQPSLFGWDLGIGAGAAFPRLQFCFLVLAVLVLLGLGVARLRTSRLGSAMLAVRANERAAAAAGISVVWVKIVAFAIGAFIAGIGGSFLAYRQGTVSYEAFTVGAGLALFTTAYLSGITSVSGGINAGIMGAGGLVFIAMDRWLSLGGWYEVVMALLLVLTVVFNPEGIAGGWHAVADRLHQRRKAAAPPKTVPDEPADSSEPDKQGKHDERARPSDEADREGIAVAGVADTGAKRPDLLALRGVKVAYGGVVAVSDVSFDVAEGTIVGLIGPNGAGKTTLVEAIGGFVTAGGSVSLAGESLVGKAPHQRIRAGLGRTFQAIELYDDLSVEENVRVGLGSGRVADQDQRLDNAFALLGISEFRQTAAGDLSQGRRQLVSIARALVGRPRMLLLDEPAAGLDTTESQWLADRLRRVRDAGVTILLIDHDMGLVLSLCDRVHVLDFGKLIASGTPAEIRANRAVTAAYLGGGHSGDHDAATEGADESADTDGPAASTGPEKEKVS